MILLISPHTVIKRNYYVNNFEIDSINKLEDKSLQIYSQGINLANMLKILQTEPFLLTFFGGVNGKHIKNYLHVNNIKSDNVHVSKNSYEKINIIDKEKGSKTVIRDFFVAVSEKVEMQYVNKIKEGFKRVDMAIIDDRLRFYVSTSAIDQIYEEAKKTNVRIIQDIKTEIDLDLLMSRRRYGLKFNISSLKRNGIDYDSFDILKEFALKIISSGTTIVIFDLQTKVYIFSKDFCVSVKKVSKEKMTVLSDATDALLAGIAMGISKGYEYEKTLRLAYAAELATNKYEGIENLNRKLVFDMRKDVKIEIIKYDE